MLSKCIQELLVKNTIKIELVSKYLSKIWVRAYLMIVVYYAINYAISVVAEYQVFNPSIHILWNGLYMFEVICILLILTFIWAFFLYKFNTGVQVVGHIIGLFVNFAIMGSTSYFFEFYLDGFIYFDDWLEYMGELLSWDALRFHDQYLIAVFIFYILKYLESLKTKDEEKTALALKNKEMELSLLKSQINPHFLFNTLNSISTLIYFNKDQARKMITSLSDIFRYALDSHGDQLVDLSQELSFIDNYIKIQQVRFEGRLVFNKNIEAECMGIKIPPMILQPLIENAVKYGVGPKEDGGTIQLVIRRTINSGVYFEVEDDGLGINAPKVLDGSSSGIGMKNTDQRLKNFFGPASGLKVLADDKGYKVSFIILNTNQYFNGNQYNYS